MGGASPEREAWTTPALETRQSRFSPGLRSKFRPGVLPNFLLIGAMRSGTTALADQLRAHPEIFFAKKKEIHFFDQEANYWKGIEWYKRWFADVRDEKAIGEGTPIYMYFPPAIERIASLLPDAKLLAILRNPVDRAYSHYWRNRIRRRERLEFAEAVGAEAERSATGNRRIRNNLCYLSRGRYLEQLRRVCEYFPRERLHVLIFEEFRDRSADAYAGVCRFLEVDDTFVPPNLGDSAGTIVGFRSGLVRRVARQLPRGLGNVVNRPNTMRGSYTPMDPSLRAELLARFEEHNAALAAWLGRDLEVWAT